jgi:Tfp pilus assembly protein PilF
MPALSWQTVVIGDPLCAPFRTRSLTPQEIDKGIDPDTELPGYFSSHRLRPVTAAQGKPGAVDVGVAKLLLRAEVRLARQDLAGAQKDFEEATSRDKRQVAAQALLAQLYEQNKEYEKAEAGYRAVLEVNPDNWLVLNNLAYSLAVRRKAPKEALPLAEKAYKISNSHASVADTLGWIYYLTGERDKAKGLLEAAAKGLPESAEVHLHLAVVFADLGQTRQAAEELDRALKLDSKLESTDDVKQLRTKIKMPVQGPRQTAHKR